MIKPISFKTLAGLMLVWAALSSAVAHASVGQVLFSIGQTDIKRGTSVFPGLRGTPLEVADEITVGPQGRAQLAMIDGAIIALQPNSIFIVQDYKLPETTEAPAERISIMSLIKGGLRTVTGLIGKKKEDKYSINTPVATIGVRGTDYRIALCSGDCPGTPDGLYLGVSGGKIFVSNGAGSLELSNSEFAYVASADSAPQKNLGEPGVLEVVLGSEDSWPPQLGDEPDNCHCAPDVTNPEHRAPDVPDKLNGTSLQMAAYSTSVPAVGDINAGATQGTAPVLTTNQDGELTAFRAAVPAGEGDAVLVPFQLGQASITNVGFDPDSGLRWGRWQGTARIDGEDTELGANPLHWVISASQLASPVIPLTGSASYSLVGNTDPTDNLGNIGTLGSAQFSANFTEQTVSSTLGLIVGGQVWSASGSGNIVPRGNGSLSPLFAGNYSQVTAGGQTQGNSGSFAGFFTGANAPSTLPAGAGLTYSLSSGGSVVSGAAAFAEPVQASVAP